MKLTEHNRSFYMFSIQTFTGTSSLSLNTDAVQDQYSVIPELVVFRKELVVLLYSTLSKSLSSRLIIYCEVCRLQGGKCCGGEIENGACWGRWSQK